MNSTLFRKHFRDNQVIDTLVDDHTLSMERDAKKSANNWCNSNSNNSNNSGSPRENVYDARNRDLADYCRANQNKLPSKEKCVVLERYVDDEEKNMESTNGKHFVCQQCGGSFSDGSNLQRHIRQKHVGGRVHLCSDCGKTFATSSGLKQHRHTHSTYKPFTCPVCKKSYTQFSNLCRHKRMHADCRTRIKCGSCDEYFPTSSALNKHRRFCEATSLVAKRSKINEHRPTDRDAKIDAKVGLASFSPHFQGNAFEKHPLNVPTADHTLDRIGENARHLASLFFPHPFIRNDLHGLSGYPAGVQRTFPFLANPFNPDVAESHAWKPAKANAQIQCNDPELDALNLTRKTHPDAAKNCILQPDPNRYKRVERPVIYSPLSCHLGIQVEASHCNAQPRSPIRHQDGSNSMTETAYFDPSSSPISSSAFTHALSPSARSEEENIVFNPQLSDNIKHIFDQIATKQRFLNWVSTLATAPNLYRPDSALPYRIGFPSFSAYFDESEKPLDLSRNRLAREPQLTGPAVKMPLARRPTPETKPGENRWPTYRDLAFTPPRCAQHLAGPVLARSHSNIVSPRNKRTAGLCPEIHSAKLASKYPTNYDISTEKVGLPGTRYVPYGYLNEQSEITKLYGHQIDLESRGGNASHVVPLSLSPVRIMSMLNSQRAMYDIIRHDFHVREQGNLSRQSTLPEERPQNCNDLHVPSYDQKFLHHKHHGQCEREKYVCKYCGKQFPRSANLTRHLRTHTGEQPYSCKYCDRCFSISSNLQRHVRNIHKKERPYTCHFCKKAFGQQTNLERHLRKHKPENSQKINPFAAHYFASACNDRTMTYDSPNSVSRQHKKDLGLSTPTCTEDGNSPLAERRTSSEDDSLNASFLPSNSSPALHRMSPIENDDDDDDDSINIVSSED